MALVAAGIGAAGSIAGSLLGGKPKAPKYTPYDVTSGLGTVDYTRGTKKQPGRIDMMLSPEQQALAQVYGTLSQQYLGDQTGSAYMGQAGGMIPGLFNDQLLASGVDGGSLESYLNNLGGSASSLQNIFGGAYGAGMNALNQPAVGSSQANTMFGMGQGLMGNNYDSVFQNRLNLLRTQAQPFEDRAQNSFLNRQYAMGRMGSTGGQRDVQAFSEGLGRADTTRQLDAMNLSEALYGRDQAMGANLMGTGMQGLFQGFGAQTGAAQGLLGLSGNVQQALMGLYGQGFGAQQGMNELVNARAQQRMANASDLFGFGQNINLSNLQTGAGLQGNQANLFQSLLNNANLGHQSGVGTASAQAAAMQGFQPNPLGAMLQGFGNSVLSNPTGYGNAIRGLFGGTQVGLTPGMISTANAQLASLPKFGI